MISLRQSRKHVMTSRNVALLVLIPTVLALSACGIERRQDRREDRRQDRDDEVSQTKAAETVLAANSSVGPEASGQFLEVRRR